MASLPDNLIVLTDSQVKVQPVVPTATVTAFGAAWQHRLCAGGARRVQAPPPHAQLLTILEHAVDRKGLKGATASSS